jgi:hypothetical protein
MVRGILLGTLLSTLLLVSGLASRGAAAVSAGIDPVPLPVWRDQLLVPGTSFYTLGAPAMALDPDGNPHLVYGQNILFHTWFDGREWHSETIDSSHAWQRESVMAIDDSGTIYIADYKNDDLSLRILEPGGSWQKISAPFPHLVNFSMALDSSGRPHIVAGPYYYNPNLAFVHGFLGPEGWSEEIILAENAYHKPISIAMDRNDQLVLLYERYGETNDERGVWAARQKEGDWQYARLSAGCLHSGNSLAVDHQDRVHALFSEDCDKDLIYAVENRQAWDKLVVSTDAADPALALDNTGIPHVVYGSHLGQLYATLKGATWETKIVKAGNYGAWYNQLRLDSAGAAHILSINGNLQYTTNSSGQWQVSTPVMLETFGKRNALALDAVDTAHLLYHKYEAGELYWASGSGGDLETELLGDAPFIGLEIALAVDTLGRPHAAFVNAEANQLLAGLRQGDVWSLEPIAVGGTQLSMAVDGSNQPHLALIQDQVLTYWTKTGDDWVSEPVAEVGTSMVKAWLALDSLDRAHIAYSDMDGAFITSRQEENSWTKEPVPFETIERFVWGADDQPYILYSEEHWEYYGRYPMVFVSLWFAERNDEDWSVEWLWEEGSWYDSAELAVDKNNQVHVAFRSVYGDIIYLQRENDGLWQMEDVAWPGNGIVSMAIGQDGQPRLLSEDGSSLFLSTRDFLWLDQFRFLPVLVP